ncbi:tetratricopeptide repeat protein [Burkholderia cepacia]|uniref:tetratricopeptide repeat protein n=1 Tax=Burkholderia cepacia TaxID=292 RepID=UPI0009BFC169|nr:hypothetical protein [Burkholderia cepacia]
MNALLVRLRSSRKPTPYRSALATAEQEMRMRAWSNAADAYQRAFDLSPKSVELLVQIGHCKKELGDFASAESHYNKYLTIHPNDVSVRDHLSFVIGRQRATTPIRDVSSEKSHISAGAMTEREKALALLSAKHWKAAAEALEFLCNDENENHDDLWCLLGHARKESADFDGAKDAYVRYLQYAGTHSPEKVSDAYLQLGHLCKVEGNYRMAFDFYIKATEHIGDSNDRGADEIEDELRELAPLLFPTFSPIK